MFDFIKKLFRKENDEGPIASTGPLIKKRSVSSRIGTAVRRRIPKNIRGAKFNVKNVNLQTINENSRWFQLGLILIAVLLASAIASRVISLFVRPVYTPLPTKRVAPYTPPQPTEDFTAIEKRNIFDVENKIPDPFDQGILDCFSQARASTQRMTLLGTIVMANENLSVALIQDEGSNKIAVKKEDIFSDSKFQALKIERKKFCFQVRSNQEFEFIEIPEEGGLALAAGVPNPNSGIVSTGETNFTVKKDFLDEKIKDLNTVLQTAKAVPYMDGAKMKGFLIQSIDPESPFAQLGIRQGDVLSGVNNIVLDNAGKGLEAFQRLRTASKIELKIIRGGQEMNLSYELKM